MNFKELLDQDRRLVILRSLLECQNSANESILQDCLHAYGHKISRDLVKTYIDYLAEQNLVTVKNVAGFLIVQITERGEDIAKGYATHHGVKKPRATSYD